jgi:hypothetical protein
MAGRENKLAPQESVLKHIFFVYMLKQASPAVKLIFFTSFTEAALACPWLLKL